ncbi:hypothetical protein CDIK_1005 [Cucumispora dikerogammari]|nr:hypothetical protein CDIK_1005 [Cucumispora dikerogammari]
MFNYILSTKSDTSRASSESKDLIKISLPSINKVEKYKIEDKKSCIYFEYLFFFWITFKSETMCEHYKTGKDFNTEKFKVKACAPKLSADNKLVYNDKDFKVHPVFKELNIQVQRGVTDKSTIFFRLDEDYTTFENPIIKYLVENQGHLIKFVVKIKPIKGRNIKSIRFETKPVRLFWGIASEHPVLVEEATIKHKSQKCYPSIFRKKKQEKTIH